MRLDINAFFPGYRVSPLGEADLAAALALCQSNPLYYRHFGIQPTLENLRENLTALPPGKALEDKYFLGLWQGGKLIALLDLIAGYPEPDTAWIGWLILDQSCQGRGAGLPAGGGAAGGAERGRICPGKAGLHQGQPPEPAFLAEKRFFPSPFRFGRGTRQWRTGAHGAHSLSLRPEGRSAMRSSQHLWGG